MIGSSRRGWRGGCGIELRPPYSVLQWSLAQCQHSSRPALPRRSLESLAERAEIGEAGVEHDAVLADRARVAQRLELVALHRLHLAVAVTVEDAPAADEARAAEL